MQLKLKATMRIAISKGIVLIAILLFPIQVISQNISGVINTYASVTTISGNDFTISNIAGSGTISAFDAGATILIIQMKGATIETNDAPSYGDLLSYGNAGNYEFATISSRTSTTITINNLQRSYDASDAVQVIAYTEYTSPTVTGSITPIAWDASLGRGGVIVLSASGNITLGADIDASSYGFEGGSVNNNYNGNCSSNNPYVTNITRYAVKGEGIIQAPSSNRSRGKITNGGGGAAPKNAGGGGGGNYTSGGDGGWGSNCSSTTNGGGIGGQALSYTSGLNKVFLGGGGGGGQENNGQATDGGAGGGIIFLFADTLKTDCVDKWGIYSDGMPAADSNNEGAGGGGAGGVISVTLNAFDPGNCSINIQSNGGAGGSVGHNNSHGGGGGGGTGAILTNISLPDSVCVITTAGEPGKDCTSCGSSGTGGGECTECSTNNSPIRPWMNCNSDISTEIDPSTCIAVVEYDNIIAIDSVSSTISNFTLDYDTINWTESIDGDGSVDFSNLDTTLIFTSANDNSTNAETNYCIVITADGTMSFDWSYSSSDTRNDPDMDMFGYVLNGTFTQMSSSSGTNQLGTESITVNEGDIFCFSQRSSDGANGSASSRVINFSAPGYQVPVTLNSGLESGESFPVGLTTVQYIATYNSGAKDTCTFIVTVTESTAPIALCQDITISLDENGTKTITSNDIDNGSSDNCGIQSRSIDSSTFDCDSIGVRTVMLIVTDSSGNTATCTSLVTVEDNLAPSITCLSNQNVDYDSNCQYTLQDYTSLATTDDNCDASVSVTQNPSSGTVISTTTIITLTATDDYGNTAACTFDIIPEDNTDPTISCPSNQNVDFDADCEYTLLDYTGLATTDDNCDNNVAVTQSPASGSTITSTTTITLTATDDNGNTATCTFDVIPTDNTDPTISCISDQNVDFDSNCQYTLMDYTGLATTDDNCDINVAVTQSPASSTVITTTTTITLTATDDDGNTATCTFDIIPEDNTGPSITCPGNQNVIFTPDCDYDLLDYTGLAVANDNCDNSVVISQSPIAGTTITGTTTITLTARDDDNNTNTCTFDVVPSDNIPPSVSCSDITVTLSSGSVSIVPNDVYSSGSDNCGTVNLVSVSPNAFSCSEIGDNTVTLTVNDGNGNTNTCTARVTVQGDLSASATGETLLCNGDTDGDITLTLSGGTSPYSFDWDNDGTGDNDDAQNQTGLSAGTYNVTITDTNGCTTTSSATIAEPTSLTASATGETLLCNGDTDGDITLTVSGGTSPYRFDWDSDGIGDNDDAQNQTGLSAGTYNVTITDTNGCTTTTSATIAEPSALSVANYLAEVCTDDAGSINMDNYNSDVTSESGNLVWYYDEKRTNPVSGVPPVVSVVDGDTIFYEFTQSGSGCTADGFVEFDVDESFCPLPVELIYFRGEDDDCDILLEWATQSEVNASHFEIQKSRDGEEFEKIDEIAAYGDTDNLQYYDFYDTEVSENINYYRLKQIDRDGTFEYSEIIIIRLNCFNEGITKVNLYPNPVVENGEINIFFNSLVDKNRLEVKIIDALGRIVQTQPFDIKNGYNAIKLNLSSLPAGNYFINIEEVRGKGITKPFIIIRR